MTPFKALLTAYLQGNPDFLPPADTDDDLSLERDGLEWKVSVRNGGEVFVATVDSEDLFGWLWMQQNNQQEVS